MKTLEEMTINELEDEIRTAGNLMFRKSSFSQKVKAQWRLKAAESVLQARLDEAYYAVLKQNGLADQKGN